MGGKKQNQSGFATDVDVDLEVKKKKKNMHTCVRNSQNVTIKMTFLLKKKVVLK